MLKNDRMMMILTGLVLAIFAGTMVKYGDRIMGLMSDANTVSPQDDSYSVRAGSSQILDVLSNDKVKGQIVVLSNPSCGAVELTGSNKLSFSSTTSCEGPVEFAYCVSSDGKCEPNNVKINVISVAYAQNNGSGDSQASPSPANTHARGASAPVVAQAAPQVETFSVEMSPPTLASPSISEAVSPSVAVASIRQPTGGLTQSTSVDQNISTQNSASVAQTATAAPTVFGAPDMGETNNIMLGSSGQRIATNAPTSLQPTASSNDSAVAVAEHGPEALASLSAARIVPASTERAPLSTNPERTSFNPDNAQNTQTAAAEPDARFNATPIDTGPIALVALNPVTSGNASGESLNVFLSEPGLQSFASQPATPSALAPAAPGPVSITVLERAPNVAEAALPPRPIGGESTASVFYSTASAQGFSHARGQAPSLSGSAHARLFPHNTTTASQVQVSVTSEVTRKDIMSPYITLSHATDIGGRSPALQGLAMANATTSLPNISLTPPSSTGGASIQQARLEPPVQTLSSTRPAQNSTCNIDLSAERARGSNIAVSVSAPCKPAQMVTFEHAGLAFSMLTDQQGTANVVIPALETNAEISVMFTDGSQATTGVAIPDIDGVMRVGLTWENGMNLDLQANEFGSTSLVNAQSPRDYRSARLQGGGYMMLLGDPSLAGGKQAEVYSIPIARQQRGTIALSVVLDNPDTVCGRSILAKTVRSRTGQTARMSSIRFTVPACGTVDSQIILPGAVSNIRLAGR